MQAVAMGIAIGIEESAKLIASGKIIAYPTEAVYGLGCDPHNQKAVHRLIEIKQRPKTHGFILVASDFEMLQAFCADIDPKQQDKIMATWPGPYTWIFPKSSRCPAWLCGEFDSIAVRVSAHPVVKSLCVACNTPLVSSSANLHGEPPLKTPQEVMAIFGSNIDGVVEGELGSSLKPTSICDAVSGKILRTS